MREQDEWQRHWQRRCAEDGVLPAALPARVLMGVVGASRAVVVASTAALLAGTWAVVHLAGGSLVVVRHGYYLPVLLAAIRFGNVAAVVTAVLAGLLAGPLLSVDGASTAISTSEWLARMGFFALVGGLVAWLFGHALASVQEDARLARQDRELRDAIAAGELSLRFQPVVRVTDGQLSGVEALVRWDHPDGERSPGSFLPAAERSGRIHQVGDFVLRAACEQGARWQREAVARGRCAPSVGVNLSAQELGAEDLVDRVRATLDATGLAPDRLCIEVTEGGLAQDIEGSARRLGELRDLGVCIAIDDFGTGYSSLSYVHRFPLDVLKIDRSFVEEMEHSERARTLVHGIALLCHQLGVAVVVEGVENEAQLRIAADMDCRLVQGFLLARPETAEQIGARLVAGDPLGPGRLLATRIQS